MDEQMRAGLASTLKYIADAIERDGSYAPAGAEFVIRELRAASEHFAAAAAQAPLTDARISEIADCYHTGRAQGDHDFARAIEAAHGIV